MADVYCAIYGDLDYWDGTIAWGYDATSDIHNPTAHPNQTARDAQYTAAYTSLSAWEAARGGVAQSADTEYAIIQTPWDVDDTVLVNLTFTNTPTIIIRAIGDARHAGVWDDGASSPHRLVAANAALAILRISVSSVTVDGMQIYNTEAVDSSNNCLYAGGAAYTGLRFSNLILVSENAEGIRLNNPGIQVKLWNIVIYCPDGGGQEGLWIDAVSTCEFYNSTIEGFYEGVAIDAVATSCSLKNNVIFNNTDDIFDGVGVTIDYNASDDGDGTNPQDFTAEATDWNKVFTDYANNDYSLKDYTTSPCCVGKGTDNPGSGLYSDDIKGETRTSIWDIGAFEYPAEGGEEFVRSIADTIELTDILTKAVSKGVVLADTIGITDIASRVAGFFRSIRTDFFIEPSWTQQTSSFDTTMISDIAHDQVDLWVAAGGWKIATSSNGIDWTQRDSTLELVGINGVAYNGSNLWVAVSTSGKLVTSPDGIDWTEQTSSFGTTTIEDVAYNGSNLWVAVGDEGKIATSPNGINWEQVEDSLFGTSDIYGVAYNGSNLWVAVGEDGKLATSLDGINWEQRTSSFDTTLIRCIAYNGSNLWVAAGWTGKLATSSDGINWTQQTSSFSNHIYGVAHNQSNLWVAVGSGGELATSLNGIDWEQQDSSFDSTYISDVAYDGSNLWVAVGGSGKLATYLVRIGITDMLATVGTFMKSISDSVSIGDILSILGRGFANLSDLIGITDALSKSITFTKNVIDTISISDVLVIVIIKIRKIVDTVGITGIFKVIITIAKKIDSFSVCQIIEVKNKLVSKVKRIDFSSVSNIIQSITHKDSKIDGK